MKKVTEEEANAEGAKKSNSYQLNNTEGMAEFGKLLFFNFQCNNQYRLGHSMKQTA